MIKSGSLLFQSMFLYIILDEIICFDNLSSFPHAIKNQIDKMTFETKYFIKHFNMIKAVFEYYVLPFHVENIAASSCSKTSDGLQSIDLNHLPEQKKKQFLIYLN